MEKVINCIGGTIAVTMTELINFLFSGLQASSSHAERQGSGGLVEFGLESNTGQFC